MKIIVALSAAVSFLAIAPFAYMAADTEPPFIYDETESYVVPMMTEAGHQLLIHWKIKVNRLCPGVIERSVVDAQSGARIVYDPVQSIGTLDVTDRELNRTLLLPNGISPGKKWYYADAAYACNLLQRFFPLHVRTPRLPFTVMPHPAPPAP